jgi:hypothetical protein
VISETSLKLFSSHFHQQQFFSNFVRSQFLVLVFLRTVLDILLLLLYTFNIDELISSFLFIYGYKYGCIRVFTHTCFICIVIHVYVYNLYISVLITYYTLRNFFLTQTHCALCLLCAIVTIMFRLMWDIEYQNFKIKLSFQNTAGLPFLHCLVTIYLKFR